MPSLRLSRLRCQTSFLPMESVSRAPVFVVHAPSVVPWFVLLAALPHLRQQCPAFSKYVSPDFFRVGTREAVRHQMVFTVDLWSYPLQAYLSLAFAKLPSIPEQTSWRLPFLFANRRALLGQSRKTPRNKPPTQVAVLQLVASSDSLSPVELTSTGFDLVSRMRFIVNVK